MIYILSGAVLLDLLIGDPDYYPHPVIIIGKLISVLETRFRKITDSKWGEKLASLVIVLITILVTYIIMAGIIRLSFYINNFLGWLVNIWFLGTTIAIKGLMKEANKVYQQLQEGCLAGAREILNLIVGRDTDKMGVVEIIRATVETVAENTSDGIIAPLFYFLLGGVPLAMTYKAVNTLDSMLGYKNERYRHLGWAAARLDDVANFIPARLTGFGFCLVALLCRKNWQQGFKVMFRDAGKHSSVNAGYPEAAVAGVLGVRLGGLNYYQGEASFSCYLGEKRREPVKEDILWAVKLLQLNVLILLLLSGPTIVLLFGI